MNFAKRADLTNKLGNRILGPRVALSAQLGKMSNDQKYIQQQEKHGSMQDKLDTCEYQDPVSG